MKLSYESFAYKLVITKPVVNKRKVATTEMETRATTRIRTSSKSSEEVTQQQREHMRRNKPREKKLQDSCLTMSSLLAIVVLAFLLTCPPTTKTTTNNLSKLIEAAVVRPTIFKSDTNSPETAQQAQPQPPHQLQLPHQIPNSQVNPLSGKPLFSDFHLQQWRKSALSIL